MLQLAPPTLLAHGWGFLALSLILPLHGRRGRVPLPLQGPVIAGWCRERSAGRQPRNAAKLLNERKEVEEKICLGVYLCEVCVKLHFLEAPAELQ